MNVVWRIVGIVIQILIGSGLLYAAVKITKNKGGYPVMLVIAAAITLLGMIPYVGPLLALIAFFALLTKLSDAPFWPDAVLIGIVYVALSYFFMVYLLPLLLSAVSATTAE